MKLKLIQHNLSESKTVRSIPCTLEQSSQKKQGLPLFSESDDERLEIEQKFNICVRILIPTTIDVNRPTNTSPFIEWINGFFSKYFGGSMCREIVGFYQSQQFGLVKEKIFEIEAWTNRETWEKAKPQLKAILLVILIKLRQETLFLVVNNRAYLLKRAPVKASKA